MTEELRILILEDQRADAALINQELHRWGLAFRSKHIDDRDDFLSELQHHPPDLILSDHGLPGFDGFTALALARERYPEIPFIFVSGSRSLQAVIETLKQGADAYVFKDRLATSLVPAVRRILREAEARRKGESKGGEREERLRKLEKSLAKLKLFGGLLLLCAACSPHCHLLE